MTYLSWPVYAVGDQKFSLAESEAASRLVSEARQLEAAGFRWHHVCSDGMKAYDLAEAAVRDLASRAGDTVLGTTDTLIYSTSLANNASGPRAEGDRDVKTLMAYPASRLQAEFDLINAAIIGVTQQACTGMLGAIRLARGLMAAEPEHVRRSLCLTADRFPSNAIYEQAYNPISDAAAACFVTSTPPDDTPSLRVVATHHLTNGALAGASDDETVGSYFSWTHRLVSELLDRARLAPGSIDWVVPQNTNPAAWRILSRLLQVDPEQVWCPTIADLAHMISGDNIANLADLLESGRLRPGERVLLVMAGYGMNWQATLLEVV